MKTGAERLSQTDLWGTDVANWGKWQMLQLEKWQRWTWHLQITRRPVWLEWHEEGRKRRGEREVGARAFGALQATVRSLDYGHRVTPILITGALEWGRPGLTLRFVLLVTLGSYPPPLSHCFLTIEMGAVIAPISWGCPRNTLEHLASMRAQHNFAESNTHLTMQTSAHSESYSVGMWRLNSQ